MYKQVRGRCEVTLWLLVVAAQSPDQGCEAAAGELPA